MIRRLVDFALQNRLLLLAIGVLLLVWGVISFQRLPVEAYPDVANNYVDVIAQWPGISAEQIEQQVTIPLETTLNGIPGVAHVRSWSIFGLSTVELIFGDQTTDFENRERVLERLSQVTLPQGVVPQMGTDWSPVGQIYFYVLHSTNPQYDVMNLKSLDTWVVQKYLKSVPGIVDTNPFGGPTQEYQVRLDPDKLIDYGLSLEQVEQALANNNVNGGGSFIQQGEQQLNVREVGLDRNIQDIGNTVVTEQGGTPIRIKDLGVVAQGPMIRLGQFGDTYRNRNGELMNNDDVVSGILCLQKGANAQPVLQRVQKMVQELNTQILPKGVTIHPFIDRSDLLHFTVHTVMHNLGEGIVLVIVILLLLLGNIRGALIVAVTIPFALLIAAICLDLKHIPANLISLGALDFGMVVDGAVVMVENIVRHLSRQEENGRPMQQRISEAAHEVQRPVFYAIAIIITAYLPIFMLQAVEGRIFHPMAWTVAFALLGALFFSMIFAPVLSSFAFSKGAKEWKNPVMEYLREGYRKRVRWAIHHRAITLGVGVMSLLLGIFLATSGVIGSEFMPHLDEGSIWVRGDMDQSVGPTQSIAMANQVRLMLCSFPETTECTSQTGRPDDGTDHTGFFNTEYYVGLKPAKDWRPIFHGDKNNLIAAMSYQLNKKFPTVIWGFSQPIEDNMEEAMTGVKGEMATKIYGSNLHQLEDIADQVKTIMSGVPGIKDLGVLQVTGQPDLDIQVDRQKAARWGISVAQVQDAVQTAVGGTAFTQVLKGEQSYNLTLRYLPKYRDTEQAIKEIRLLSPSGERVALAQLCDIHEADEGSEIYRQNNQRYVAVKYSVRGRPLGDAVRQAIQEVSTQVKLPRGYHISWAGEYQSELRSAKRMAVIVPITVLLIFLILYSMYKSLKWATLILATVAMASIGGLLVLLITHTTFSVSSEVGFLALFGVSVQTGVIMLEYINQRRARGESIEEAAVEGAVLRLRPIMMTMLVATLGLLPAAMSHGIGSDTQRPFAIVIVGGLIANLLMSIFLLPTLYVWIARENDILPTAEIELDH
ncbi:MULTISPECIES: CusA/CzcA family heavy metal efflux RND transporter [Acidobacterium]|uniref:Heavy metal efflux pump, CzcA family n=1 Tax=Acidobacterium capsulatum (strain ATCC 51196 / DSM 11244 / BCRC 80197 / JCM 7670 / NBRC 15755 / NCIMB 13165 / 161) TaxID=240015 RepID=C1F6Q4_ACIC5|nr:MULTISPECIES: CusA/CzcA family heavy metal efflux RND transporter [Acidobacterium]ACO31915.1 heavy metal efflux pump, CzcA family [Acidobacterium capsulatum ATCC 51196]HCT60949.1 CusA/CzcA family heavy metal efflux RND transporter [Acidobacterium sp.]